MSDWIVKIEYKNKNMETVVEKEYDLINYTKGLHCKMMNLLNEIENAFCTLTGKQKEEWSPEIKEQYIVIRHKMLDYANSIGRLPRNLTYKGIRADQIPLSEYLAKNITEQNL